MKRRTLITMVGAAAILPISGCNGGDGSDINIDTSSPEAVVESFRQAVDELGQNSSAEDIIDAIDPALHSASPLPARIRDWEDPSDSAYITHDVARIEATVIDEDLDASQLTREFGAALDGVSQTEVETIAEANALVEASLEFEEAPDGTTQHLTAPEGGDWFIVI
jgi:hypothetical protein